MKKLLYAAMFVLGTLSFSACGGSTTSTEGGDEKVVDRDTVSQEVEVQETVVETDTNTRTREVEADSTQR